MALTGTTTNLGLVNIGANHPENESAASSLSSIINALLNAVDTAIGNVGVKLVDGAIASTKAANLCQKLKAPGSFPSVEAASDIGSVSWSSSERDPEHGDVTRCRNPEGSRMIFDLSLY